MLKAVSGRHGGGNNKRGANGEDLVVRVPLGTTIWKMEAASERVFVGDVLDETPIQICKGGSGGKGNSRFTTSVNQEPLLAEAGEEGEGTNLLLELKLLADVGIIGMPNAGKSTLLSVCSRAKPKVADYAFTTIDPVLGMVEDQRNTFLLVEIPGLLEGAHQGKGLGHEFLRHAERTRLFWHLVDGIFPDILERIAQISEELRLFSPVLSEKPRVLVINKMDVTEARENADALDQELKLLGVPVFYISAVTREGLEPLIRRTREMLENIPKPRPEMAEDSVPRIVPRMKAKKLEIWKEGETYVVDSPRVARLMALANLRDSRVRIQLWRELERMGIAKALEQQGIEVGDSVRLGKVEMEWE